MGETVYNSGNHQMHLCSLGIGQYYTQDERIHQKFDKAPLHHHAFWEFTLNTRGSGETQIGNQIYHFTEETMVCIPPGMPHSKWGPHGFVDYYFHTDAFLSVDKTPFPEDKPIILQDDSDHSLKTLISLLFSLYYRKRPEERAVIRSIFESLMQLLVVRVGVQQVSPLVEQVKSAIISSFTNPEIDLAKILSSCHYSENYMRKMFKNTTGMTPVEYLTSLRMDYARQLLDQKQLLNLSISAIARMCGFYDVHYFSRVFHAWTGLSPREYVQHGDLPSAEKG